MGSMEVFEPTGKIAGVFKERYLAPCIGHLVVSDTPGEVLVQYDASGPQPARLVAGLNRIDLSKPENNGREVLVVLAEGDPHRPIIVGLMEDPLDGLVSMEIADKKPNDLLMDGERVILEGKEEIVLKCGSGSITLRKDGKIVMKGTHLLSRSSGPIRVKGGSVDIN